MVKISACLQRKGFEGEEGKIREKNTTNPLVFLWSGTKTKNCKRKYNTVNTHTKRLK